jgi:hypothetical protein
MNDPRDQILFHRFSLIAPMVTDMDLERLIRILNDDQKTMLVDGFATCTDMSHRLLVAIGAEHPVILMALKDDFGSTLRSLYYLLRSIQMRRMDWEGDAVSRAYNERKEDVLARDGGCVITGLAAPAVIPEIAHIIPFALSRHLNGFDSPFYKGLRIMFEEWRSKLIWELAGGVNVNTQPNIFCLSPNLHQMLDRGMVSLCPTFNGVSGIGIFDYNVSHPNNHGRLTYEVRFRHEPEPNRHTTNRGSLDCVELRNGHFLSGVYPGDPRLHVVMNILQGIAGKFEFETGRNGERKDLGIFFV